MVLVRAIIAFIGDERCQRSTESAPTYYLSNYIVFMVEDGRHRAQYRPLYRRIILDGEIAFLISRVTRTKKRALDVLYNYLKTSSDLVIRSQPEHKPPGSGILSGGIQVLLEMDEESAPY